MKTVKLIFMQNKKKTFNRASMKVDSTTYADLLKKEFNKLIKS